MRYSSHGRRSTSPHDNLGDSVASLASLFSRHRGGALNHLAIVHGVPQLVRTSGVAQVDEQRAVEARQLGDLVLVGQRRRRS